MVKLRRSLQRFLVAGAAVLAAGTAQAVVPTQAADAPVAGHVLSKPAGRSTAHVMPQVGPASGRATSTPSIGGPMSQAVTNGSGNLVYNGGLVQTAPRVYLDFWGNQWLSGTDSSGFRDLTGENYAVNFVDSLAGSAYLNSQTQYCQGDHVAMAVGSDISGCPGNSHAGVAGGLSGHWMVDDAAAAPTPTSEQDVANEADRARGLFGVAAGDVNSLIIVLSPSGASAFSLPTFSGAFCGFHDWTVSNGAVQTVFAYIPWSPDATPAGACHENEVNATDDSFGNGHLDGMSITVGHEIAEAITDPLPGAQIQVSPNQKRPFFGWVDTEGFETGDKCDRLTVWPEENMMLVQAAYAVQPLWSDAGASCAMQDVGGVVSAHAAIAAWDATHLNLFVRGGDSQIYWNSEVNDAWSGWVSLGGSTPSSPAAVSWGPNRIDVFVRGRDNGLWHKSWTNVGGWSPNWDALGGFIASSPAVSSWAAFRLDVFARGGDNALWHKSWNGSTWSGWDGQGGQLTADPAAVSWGPNRIDVFVRGGDTAVWHKSWNGTSWSGYDGLGGGFASGLGAASTGAGLVQVFGIGGDHKLYRMTWNGSQWIGWTSLDGIWPSDPAAIAPPGTGVRLVEFFMVGSITQSVERLVLGI